MPTSIRSAIHTCTWLYVCIHVAACPPSPTSHTLIICMPVCPECPRCMPIARLGLIHNTMPSHIRTPFSKSLVNVWVRLCMFVRVHVNVCVCMYVSHMLGGLKACVCLHVRVCICVCKCMRACVMHTHARTYNNNGGLKFGLYACTSLLIGIHACIIVIGTHTECNTYY